MYMYVELDIKIFYPKLWCMWTCSKVRLSLQITGATFLIKFMLQALCVIR